MKKCIAKAFLIILGLSTIVYAAEPDVTGLVPAIYWDFDVQPNASQLPSENKGTAAISFTHEGTVSYVEKEPSNFAIDTGKFTPYSSDATLISSAPGLTLAIDMTLGPIARGITFNYRSGAGDIIICRGEEEDVLMVGFGGQQQESSKFLTATVTDGYHLIILVVEETGMQLYVDGKLEASTTEFTAWHSSKMLYQMQFGSHLNGVKGAEKKYGGYISDLRFYDVALTQQQIGLLCDDLSVLNSVFIEENSPAKVFETTATFDYEVVVNESRTATVAIVYDRSPSFTSPITNVIETAVGSGSYTKTLSNFDFSETYYYKLLCYNDVKLYETSVSSFKTQLRVKPSEYIKKIPIKISGYTGETELTDFPVLIKLSEEAIPGFIYSECYENGKDIVFTTLDNVVIPHEIESWDTEGTSYIWVKVPTLSGTETTIWLYYSILDGDNIFEIDSKDVWSQYAAVFHGGEEITDATGNSELVDCKTMVPEKQNGIVAGNLSQKTPKSFGLQFSNPVSSGAVSSESNVSVSGWFKRTNASNTSAIILSNKDYWWEGRFVALIEKGNYFSVYTGGAHHGTKNKGALVQDEWGYLAFTYDNINFKSYFNGESIYESAEAKPLSCTSGNTWSFGSYSRESGDDAFLGDMDELRVYNGTASSDWIKAEYDSVVNNSSVVEFEDVVDLVENMPILEVPIVVSNQDGTFTISVVVDQYAPASINCIVGGKNFEMSTTDTSFPMTYSTVVDNMAPGTYVPIVEAGNGFVSKSLEATQIYVGAFDIEKLSDADESSMQSGCFRISRVDNASEALPEISFNCSFSGDGIALIDLPENIVVKIPQGMSYVDVFIPIKYMPEFDLDATLTMTISGDNVGLSSEGTLVIKNQIGNATVRYVAPDGDDLNLGTSSETPKKTIHAAIESLIPFTYCTNCTVYVEPGLYKISKPIYVTNAIHVLGLGETAADVVVSNTVGSGWDNKDQRVFVLNHPDAIVASVSMQKGSITEGKGGGVVFMDTLGGTVSNCVIEAGYSTLNSYGAGAVVYAGLITHTIFRDNECNSNSGGWQGSYRGGVLELSNNSRAENCLLEDNYQYQNVSLVHLYDKSIMRNCTIVNTGLSVTNDYCEVFSPVRIDSGARAENVVIAGVTNTLDGAACLPSGNVANFVNGAVDGDITDLGFPENTIVGTATEFFKNYAAKDYRPNENGPLVGKGVNYSPMAALDLAGVTRLVGSRIDIGCYEAPPFGTLILIK